MEAAEKLSPMSRKVGSVPCMHACTRAPVRACVGELRCAVLMLCCNALCC